MLRTWTRRIAWLTAFALAALFVAAGWFAYQLTARVDGHYFDADGFKIHYTDEGSGEAVILVHGLGANADLNWRRAGTTEMLAKEFRVVSLDIRGHGLSEKSHDPADYGDEMAEDIVRLMDHLDIPRAHLAGYSLGGFLALKCVAEHPDRIISAAYCASGWKDPAGPEDILSPYRRPEAQQTRVHGGIEYHLAHADSGRFTEGPVDWIKDAIGDSLVDRQSIRAMKKGFRELIVSEDELAAIRTPGICFIGTNDGLKPYADDMHRVQPAIQLVVLDGANHITTAVRADFQRGLMDFFKAHGGASPQQAACATPASRAAALAASPEN